MVRKFPSFRSERKKRSTSEGTPQFPNGISGKLPYYLTSNRDFRIFWPNGKHPMSLPSFFTTFIPASSFPHSLPLSQHRAPSLSPSSCIPPPSICLSLDPYPHLPSLFLFLLCLTHPFVLPFSFPIRPSISVY